MATEIISRAEAQARGLTRYFTGKPCKYGHISERQLGGICVECHRERGRKRDPEKRSIEYKAYRENNLEKERARRRERYVKNKGKEGAYQKARYREDPEKFLARTRAWEIRNPLAKRSHKINRRSRKLANGGSHTTQDISDILSLQHNKCAYCRLRLKKKFEIDHVIPLRLGGTSHRSNLQILCMPCNRSKWARDPVDFARSLGMLL